MKIPTKLLDDMWRTACKARENYRCVVCKKGAYLNVHHIVGRQNYALRWAVDNGICLCPEHHKFSRTMSAHITPTLFMAYIPKDTISFIERWVSSEEDRPTAYHFLFSILDLYPSDDNCVRMRERAIRVYAKAYDADWKRAIWANRARDRRAARQLADRAGDRGHGS